MATSQSHNPYVGPRPFEREEQNLFFGREREISELQSLLTAHRTLLLYAASGAGKTSLLNAGLLPLMEQEGFEVLPIARVRGLIPGGVRPEDISNPYVFNTLMSWTEDEAAHKTLARMSLAEFLKTREHILDSEGFSAPRLIIFDQFEELFTLYQQYWKQREDFFHQVAEALEQDPVLRVLFVLREDYLASLDPYVSLLPEQLRARYRLVRLRSEDACQAVEGPLKGSGRSFADGVAARLVGELLKTKIQSVTGETVEAVGEYVEPVQLQIVCRNLWDSLPADVTVITSEHLRSFGDVDEALKGFYEDAVQKTISEATVKEEALRKWFAHELITPAGTRGTVYRGKDETDGIPNAAVDILEDEHIVRGEVRAGAHWYELTHDRLIEPIRNSNEPWFHDLEVEQARLRARKKLRRYLYRVAVLVLLAVASSWYLIENTKPTITANSGPNGSISPSGQVKVVYYLNKSFTITPKPKYRIEDVVVDKKSEGAKSTYTFERVTRDHTIVASFAKGSTIKASFGPNGSISPTGAVVVTPGDSMAFEIKPDPGYRIEDVKVDGNSVGAVSSYTFNVVTGDRTISATFELGTTSKPEPPPIPERAKLLNKNSSKYLAVAGADTCDGGNVIIWDDMGQRDIKWYLEQQGEEGKHRYKIQNLNSGKYLAVAAAAATNGGNVIQWRDMGQPDILWELQHADFSCYKIRNVNSGKYLAVSGGSTRSGGNVIQWEDKNQSDIVWCLENLK